MKSDIELFKEFYSETKDNISLVIDKYNKELVKDKKGYLKDNLELFANLNSDGKLIRATLISLGYKIASLKNIDYSFNLGLAYELFQTSVLIHDDIIDNDNLRRGKETIHYANYKRDLKYDEESAKKNSESIGICIGDYGFYEANKIIIDNYCSDSNFKDVFSYYNDIVLKTIEGELIDVKLSFDSRYKLDDTDIEKNIMEVYKLKTAFYTIIGPLSLGLILGGIKDSRLDKIKEFGEKIGIAFQIQDDILGIYSNLGKEVGSDIKEYKQTILFANAIKDTKYKKELLKYYGKKDINMQKIEEVRRIFKESLAYEKTYDLMNSLYKEAKSIINEVTWINEEDKKILKGFVDYLVIRNK